MCPLVAVLGLVDVFVPDPLPYVDEAILILAPLFKCPDIRSKVIPLVALASELTLRLP
jgi:hypothetical protein